MKDWLISVLVCLCLGVLIFLGLQSCERQTQHNNLTTLYHVRVEKIETDWGAVPLRKSGAKCHWVYFNDGNAYRCEMTTWEGTTPWSGNAIADSLRVGQIVRQATVSKDYLGYFTLIKIEK